ncbi:MAG: CocE/NonD family hydrolase [Phenylobacterium sp.]|nr:CocE/NonD family hydrolase [Phenylobacterium sp.]
MRALIIGASLAVGLVMGPGPGLAQAAKVSQPGRYQGYAEPTYDGVERSAFYVPMRDGTRLAVDLFRPARDGVVAAEQLPVIWMHTPYNRRTYAGGATVDRYPGYAGQLVKYGYNVAIADFRGLYASFGTNQAYNRGEWVNAARMDAYDITEWLAAQPWSSGKVGMWGCSATGGSQMQAATTRPPSLKAIIPMSAEFDAYPFGVLGGVASSRPIAAPNSIGADPNAARDRTAAPVDGPEGEALLAQAIAEHAGNVESPGVLPFRDSRSEPLGETWWVKSSPSTYLAELKASGVGVYAVANWDEAGTRHGSFFTFANLGGDQAKLLVGPATHCAWSAVREQTGFELVTEELRFFDHWLKGVENGVMDEPAVTYFTYNAPDGEQWRTAATWPLESEVRTPFYLAEAALTQAPGAAGVDRSGFSAPVTRISTTIAAPEGGLAYDTAPLSADLEVTGHPVVQLWLATEAGDVDVLARLEDVAPDGRARSYQMVGQLRASHRRLAQAPYDHLGLPWRTFAAADAAPMPVGEAQELVFDMLPMSYIFKAGHRVRLTLSFSDPLGRQAEDLSAVVRRGGDTASALILPVIPAR